MNRRSELSDLEKNTIFILTREGYNITEIASLLHRSKATIRKYSISNDLDKDEEVDVEPVKTEMDYQDDGDPKAKDYMINRTMGKKDKVVSIMTKEASAKGDEHRLKIFKPNRISKTAIHRIADDGKD